MLRTSSFSTYKIIKGVLKMEQIMGYLPMVVLVAVFYFLLIRPQQKRAKEAQNMQSSIEKGNKIVTIGGMHCTVDEVKETTLIVKTVDGSKMEFEKSAVRQVKREEV
ncbi:MAG: preprotein translocase subunit YajC [Bacillales bacterium]|jgi:preprotein translocase subunit YajC|nr:preprotein translocase subunit YajC [Bacillales bacterium]